MLELRKSSRKGNQEKKQKTVENRAKLSQTQQYTAATQEAGGRMPGEGCRAEGCWRSGQTGQHRAVILIRTAKEKRSPKYPAMESHANVGNEVVPGHFCDSESGCTGQSSQTEMNSRTLGKEGAPTSKSEGLAQRHSQDQEQK